MMPFLTGLDDDINELALFAGAGGGILGGMLQGFRTVCAVEIDPSCIGILLQRQNDGILPLFPVWDDIRTFDGTPWRGCVDAISGGFPCQDISPIGTGAGIDGPMSGLWMEMQRIIREVRPRFVFVENSPMLVNRGLGKVLGCLAALGYDAKWGVFSACSVGLSHTRERLFIVADADGIDGNMWVVNDGEARKRAISGVDNRKSENYWVQTLAEASGEDHAVANRLDRLKAIGNGQVPAVAALAWRVLNQ